MIASPRHARSLARASGVCMSTVRPASAAPFIFFISLASLGLTPPALAAPVPAQPAPAPTSPTPLAPAQPAPAKPAPTAPAPASPTAAPPVQRPTNGPATAPATPGAAPTAQPALPATATPDPAAVSGSPDAALQPEPTPTPAAPGLAESLLGPSVNQHPTTRPTSRLPTEEESIAAEDAASSALYRDLYRPKNNPGRLNVSARVIYGILGSPDSTFSGRMGGLTGDIGQSFNKFGYALTVVAQFGNLTHNVDGRQTQSIGLFGGGPTLSLGRLGLIQRGMLDVRVGYDFLVAPTRVVMDGVATGDGIRVPHGPRLALNMALLTNPGRQRRLFHAFGFTIGYQALVHDLKGDLPFANVLQFGMMYWGG